MNTNSIQSGLCLIWIESGFVHVKGVIVSFVLFVSEQLLNHPVMPEVKVQTRHYCTHVNVLPNITHYNIDFEFTLCNDTYRGNSREAVVRFAR